jgi:hypothetical protein
LPELKLGPTYEGLLPELKLRPAYWVWYERRGTKDAASYVGPSFSLGIDCSRRSSRAAGTKDLEM